MAFTPLTNDRGLLMPKREGDEQDDVNNWPEIDRMLQGQGTKKNLMVINKDGSTPAQTTAAIGSAVGGPRNGNSANPFPGGFTSQSFVDPNESLQQAIDKAPSSASLVQSYSSGFVDLTNGSYGIVLAEKPKAVFVDADLLAETPSAFNGNVLTSPEVFAGAARFWKWDSATSRVVMYNKGAAVTQMTTVKYHAVVAIDRAQYDGFVLRPGVVVVGAGAEFTKTKSSVSNTTQSPTALMFAAVVAAAYAGVSGMTIESTPSLSFVNAGNPPAGIEGGNSALVLPLLASSDCFIADQCRVVVPEGFSIPVGYCVGIFFATRYNNPGWRSKNVQISNTPTDVRSPVDAIETYSFNFNGSVRFINSPQNGCVFIDGRSNTFVFVDSNISSGGTRNRLEPMHSSLYNFPLNLGSNGPFAGETRSVVLINSDLDARVPLNTVSTGAATQSAGFYRASADPTYVDIINSNVYADTLVTNGIGAVTGAMARFTSASSSRVPPCEVTTTVGASASGFSLTVPSPLLPLTQCRLTYATQTTTAKNFGILSIAYADIIKRGSARVTVRGITAANANVKTMKLQAGVNLTLAGLALADVAGANWSSTYNNQPFEFTADITASEGFIFIKGQMLIGTTTSGFTARQAIAADQYFQMTLNSVGVATNDVVVSYQSIEVAG